MNTEGCDDTIPIGYLNNENPYAYCTDYLMNPINMQERKSKLNLLQRIQPSKICFRMPLKHVETEREHLFNCVISTEKKALVKKGLEILQIEYHDSPELLFENNINVDGILEIALRIKKLNLFHQQRRLRSKVSIALSSKLGPETNLRGCSTAPLEIDNLKDALIYCKLEDLYNEN